METYQDHEPNYKPQIQKWEWNGVSITDINQFPKGTIGFIYRITNHVDNRIYVGKKYINRGTPWHKYWGSSKELTGDIKRLGITNKELCITYFSRDILQTCDTNIRMTYYEVWWQCHYSVLTTYSYNRSILGKFYKGRI